jgi:hypothetical protein
MNINNNRSFYNNFILEGRITDWVINLLSLREIAFVAYEIGAACLSSFQTTKISQKFLKSPIRISIKKITQWLWVPIVIFGALKLVCLIIIACWYRCFPHTKNRAREENLILDSTAKDPFEIIPQEIVIFKIFSNLNLSELAVSRCISKRWNTFASTPTLWKVAIYREIAFSSKNWGLWNEDIVKGIDFAREYLSFPDNIVEELRYSHQAFPEKRIRETHVLVRMPKGLTLKKLEQFVKKYFSSNSALLTYDGPGVVDSLEDKPIGESFWLLMTTKEIEGTRNKNYIMQKNIVAELAKTARVSYDIPTTLEAATCILAEYARSQKRIFSDNPWTYTRCQESIDDNQVIVGGLTPAGLIITGEVSYNYESIGVAALRKF